MFSNSSLESSHRKILFIDSLPSVTVFRIGRNPRRLSQVAARLLEIFAPAAEIESAVCSREFRRGSFMPATARTHHRQQECIKRSKNDVVGAKLPPHNVTIVHATVLERD
jgi:hypothetical protein